MILNQFPDRTITYNNKEYLYFGGTNYLGIATNKDFQKLLVKNLKKWGSSFRSSRNANVQLKVYDDAELHLSKFVGSQDSILVSSGMLAGKLVIDLLGKTTDAFFSFPNLHAALYTAESFPINVGTSLHPNLLNSKIENVTILIDGVASGHTKPFDLSVLNAISKSKSITLVIDESHTFGILGAQGSGIFSSLKKERIFRTIMISSLGKAFGISGGCIASDDEFCNQIRNQSTYISAAGMNPAFAQTLIDGQNIYASKHQKLLENLNYLSQNLLPNKAFDFTPNYPIINILSEKINDLLVKNDIIITNFKYATSTQKLNRIIITANHRKADIEKLLSVLNRK